MLSNRNITHTKIRQYKCLGINRIQFTFKETIMVAVTISFHKLWSYTSIT